MDGFYLLIGHLIGDYILQNDWQAANKSNPAPDGLRPGSFIMSDSGCSGWNTPGTDEEKAAWDAQMSKCRTGRWACFVHCLLYTLAVWAYSFWWMPWWGLLICFVLHFAIDRWRLARLWMVHVSGQKAFATGILSPWSIIVVDNTIHLMTLAAIAMLAYPSK